MADEFDSWIEELEKRTVGNDSNRASDLEKLRSTNPDDLDRVKSALESQYQRRADPPSGIDSSEMTRRGYGSGRNETADDGGGQARAGAQPSSVAQAWNSSGGNSADSLFPDWYRELLTRQQQQAEQARAETKARADALYAQLNQRATQSLNIFEPAGQSTGYAGAPGGTNADGYGKFPVPGGAAQTGEALPASAGGVRVADPIIRNQVDVYRAEADRAKRNYLSDVAERSGPLSNIRGEQRMASERTGQNVAGFQSELLSRELTARREEIAEALRMSAGLLSGDQQRGLQQQLAMMDQAIAEAGIGLSARGQDLNYALGNRGLDVNMRGQDLSMDQFLRQLAQRSYEWDSSPMGW